MSEDKNEHLGRICQGVIRPLASRRSLGASAGARRLPRLWFALRASVMALLGAFATSAPAIAETRPTVATLIEFTPGVFLENLVQTPDGSIVFTSYFDRRLIGLSAEGQAWTLADLPLHPVGIEISGDDFVVTGHGEPFTESARFTETNRVLVVNASGTVLKDIAAPDARFLNGVAALGDGQFAIADSIAGAIWTFHPDADGLALLIADELLAPIPDTPAFRPGANGVKMRQGRLYVSNSSRGAIYAFDPSATGSAVRLRPVATPGLVDDFAFATDGTIFAATHADALLQINPAGQVSSVIETGCDGCTSVTVKPDGSLIVLTTGGLLEGKGRPARVLEVRQALP